MLTLPNLSCRTNTVLIVPGLRDKVPQHWQTLLAQRLPLVQCVPPMGREDLNCQARINAIEAVMASIEGPVIIVAHSGGCIMVAHWAQQTNRHGQVSGALLATPPDFEVPMPSGYPAISALEAGGWFPVPRRPLPFPSLVATSSNDPLGELVRVQTLARDWGSEQIHLGAVGHLNPASGYGDWFLADDLIHKLANRCS